MIILKIQPYHERLLKAIREQGEIRCDEYGRLNFSGEFLYYLAKCTGLKSKRRRHIIKRARRTILKMMKEMIEEYGK